MFCRNCGKPTPNGEMMCRDCLAEQNAQPQQEEPFAELNNNTRQQPSTNQPFQTYTQPPMYPPFQPAPPKSGNRMEGFGKALTATILSNVGFVFAYIALIVLAMATEYGYDTIYFSEISGPSFFCALIAIGLAIPSIILGAQSIKTFKTAKAENRVKPIATLILGIVGLASGIAAVSFGGLSALLLAMLLGL